MILLIDAGNTNIVLGCADGEKVIFNARIETGHTKTEDEYMLIFAGLLNANSVNAADLTGGILSCVVPTLKRVLRAAVKKLAGFSPLVVGPGLKTGCRIRVDDPAQLGSDLITVAVATKKSYKLPAAIFDLGTATTLSVVGKNGDYLGGMIIPGIRLGVDALSARASQLPYIGLEEPDQFIGTNTINCMKSGAVYGCAAMVDGICDRLENELGEKVTAIATGGFAPLVAQYFTRDILLDEDLMMRGLKQLYDMNA